MTCGMYGDGVKVDLTAETKFGPKWTNPTN